MCVCVCQSDMCVMMFCVCFTMFYKCFMMFNNVLRCLVSHASIIRSIGDCTATNHCRDHNNAAGIGDNDTEIGDDAAEIGNVTGKVIPC